MNKEGVIHASSPIVQSEQTDVETFVALHAVCWLCVFETPIKKSIIVTGGGRVSKDSHPAKMHKGGAAINQ
jgi:hypothetical protein